MALTVTNVTTATSTTSSSTLAATGVTADVGDWLVVFVAANNNGSGGVASLSTTMTDSAGNVYTNRTIATRTSGAANDGTTLGIWTAPVTTALSSGSITASFSTSTTVKALQVKKAAPASGSQVLYDRSGTAQTGSDNNPTLVTGSIFGGGYLVPINRTVFFGIAGEIDNAVSGDSDTTSGVWSTIYNAIADGGGDADSQTVASQQKTVTATSYQSWTPTLNDSVDYAMNWLVLYDAPFALVDATGVEGAAGIGSVALSLGASAAGVGVSATGQVGAVEVAEGAVVAVSGVGATVQLGEVEVPLPGGATALIAGFELVAGLGEATALINTTATVSGVQVVAYLGQVRVPWSLVTDSQTPNWQTIADTQSPGWAPVI